MCDCSNSRKAEDRIYVLEIKTFVEVDACCYDEAEKSDWSFDDSYDYEIVNIEEA